MDDFYWNKFFKLWGIPFDNLIKYFHCNSHLCQIEINFESFILRFEQLLFKSILPHNYKWVIFRTKRNRNPIMVEIWGCSKVILLSSITLVNFNIRMSNPVCIRKICVFQRFKKCCLFSSGCVSHLNNWFEFIEEVLLEPGMWWK